MKYKCLNCNYIYDEEKEAISFAGLGAEWTCPECNASKSEFEPMDGEEEGIDMRDDGEMTEEEDFKEEY